MVAIITDEKKDVISNDITANILKSVGVMPPPVKDIAKRNKLFVIEDAAQGVGVKFAGKHVGTFGEFGSFSFYGNKTITTGEGGMLLTYN